MTRSLLFSCAIPKVLWWDSTNPNFKDLGKLSAEAIECEKRIRKGINLENEYINYSLLCSQIEGKIALNKGIKYFQDDQEFENLINSGFLPRKDFPENYFSLMANTLEENINERLTASFHQPETMPEFLSDMNNWITKNNFQTTPSIESLIDFFKLVVQFGCGLVFLQTEFIVNTSNEEAKKELGWDKSAVINEEKELINIPDMEITGQPIEFFTEPSKQHLAKILRDQIIDAVTNNGFINIGGQANNDVIAEVLHEFVYVPAKSVNPYNLRITYVDGSEARYFPLFCLPKMAPRSEIDIVPLNVALMSMRHLELDKRIALCWFRNRDVSKARTLAETDEFCYKTTLLQLHESLSQESHIEINLYHTGFEPAIIGFYRALVEIILEIKNKKMDKSIQISPQYYRGEENYELGSIW